MTTPASKSVQVRFPSPDGETGCAELARLLLTTCTCEAIDLSRQLDLHEPGGTDHSFPPCARQGTGYSTGP